MLKNFGKKLIQFEKIIKILEKHLKYEQMGQQFYHINGAGRLQSNQGTPKQKNHHTKTI